MENPVVLFDNATKLIQDGKLHEALGVFLELEKIDRLAPLCYFRIAQISNMLGDPDTAYNLYYRAFTVMPDIMSILHDENDSGHGYVFAGKKEEIEITRCPLCGVEGKTKWCYPLVEADGYIDFFNPIRMWMYCESCHHMFARDFPEKPFMLNTSERKANQVYFPYYSNILSKIRGAGYASGMTLFEVGIGACECMLAAREIGYETFGIDVIGRHVEDAKKKYGLDAEIADFVEYDSDRLWDVIIMGDVLEHVSDPAKAIAKAESMLNDEGALWISTPNFESAISAVENHFDVMRRQQFHLNYFSQESLYMLLEKHHLAPVDYQISSHFKGSMEVIAVKESRL